MEQDLTANFAREHVGKFILFRMPKYEKGDHKPVKEAQIRGVSDSGHVGMTTRVAAIYLLEPLGPEEDESKPRGIKGFIPEHYESDYFNVDDILVIQILGDSPLLPHIIDGIGAWDTKAPVSDINTQ